MIDPKELRLGNIVSVLGIPTKVLPNLILELYQYEQANKVNLEIQSIKLTEEWLIKLGFGKAEDENEWGLLYDDDVHGLYYDTHDQSVVIEAIYEKTGIEITSKFEYVHQLQNLYFALTGNQLKIKE